MALMYFKNYIFNDTDINNIYFDGDILSIKYTKSQLENIEIECTKKEFNKFKNNFINIYKINNLENKENKEIFEKIKLIKKRFNSIE